MDFFYFRIYDYFANGIKQSPRKLRGLYVFGPYLNGRANLRDLQISNFVTARDALISRNQATRESARTSKFRLPARYYSAI